MYRRFERCRRLIAFTLVELSLSLAVVGVLLGGAVVVVQQQAKTSVQDETESDIDAIVEALINYKIREGHLPCPASLTELSSSSSFGKETNSGDCTFSTAPDGVERFEAAAGSEIYVLSGMVPVAELNLPIDNWADRFGNRYSYTVMQSLTESNTFDTGTAALSIGIGSLNRQITDGAFVVVSHGKEGEGAYRFESGVLMSPCGSTSLDSENCDGDITFVDADLADVVPGPNYYSDTIRWRGKRNFEQAEGTGGQTSGSVSESGSPSASVSPGSPSPIVYGTPPDGYAFRIDGLYSNHMIGASLAIGDINGDGFGDSVIAKKDFTNQVTAYVIFGSAQGVESESIALDTLNGTNGFQLLFDTGNSYSDSSAVTTGDVNGDGIDDIIVGSDSANDSRGYVFVVFGKSTAWAASSSLTSLVNGTDGFRLDGWVIGTGGVGSVLATGDINSDGFDDVIVGNPNGENIAGHASAGQTYVVFGKASGWAASTVLNTLNGTNGVLISGQTGFTGLSDRNGYQIMDRSGSSVASGDLNGDGYDDVIIGASNAKSRGGYVYVVLGKGSNWNATMTLSSLDGTNGFRWEGNTLLGSSCWYSSGVVGSGDINGDGYDDLIVGSPTTCLNQPNSGSVFVVFGKSGTWESKSNLLTLNGTNGFRVDGSSNLGVGNPVVSGDMNGDGFDDVILGAMSATNGVLNGHTYVVFGKSTGWSSVTLLSSLNGTNGHLLHGSSPNDRAGYWLAVGDMTGDNHSDLLIGATGTRYSDSSAGSVYGVYGRPATDPLPGAANDLNTLAGLNQQCLGPNLVTNGGLELPDVPAGNFTRYSTTAIPGWSITANHADVMDNFGAIIPSEGNQYIELIGAGTANGSIVQAIPTGGDHNFRLTFSYYPRNGGGNPADAIQVYWNDLLIDTVLRNEQAWITREYVLSGAGPTTNLEFRSTGATAGIGGLLDNIRACRAAKSNAGLLRDLKAYWDFNAPTGNALDVHQRHELSESSGTIAPGVGKLGNSRDIESDDTEHFVVADHADFSGGDKSFTISTWVRLESKVTDRVILSKGWNSTPDANSEFDLRYNLATNRFVLSVNGPDGVKTATHSGTVATGTWYHIIAYHNAERNRIGLQVNGGTMTSVTHANGLNNGTDPLVIGHSIDQNLYFDGLIDDLAIWRRILTPVERANLYAAGSGRSYDLFPTGSLGTVPEKNAFRLDGEWAATMGGSSTAIGDINGDGFGDAVIGAIALNSVYVVFGSASGITAHPASMIVDGTNGFRIGGSNNEWVGWSVAAGDINGDGFDDVIIGAQGYNSNMGAAYVVLGKANWSSTPSVSLTTLSGTTRFRLTGAEAASQTGVSVSSGDINGDGLDDIIIGAPATAAGGSYRGSTYVVFGKPSGWASSSSLSALDGSTGFAVHGDTLPNNSRSGWSVANGDFNGDGYDDIIISGLSTTNYVIFGKSSGWMASQSLTALNGQNGFALTNIIGGGFAASQRPIMTSGDINGDGYDDLIMSGPSAISYAGSTYVLFGKKAGWTSSISMATLNGANGFAVQGVAGVNSRSGASLASGDVNGDGFDDIVIGEYTNGVNNNAANVIFGKPSGWTATLSLGSLTGQNGFRLYSNTITDQNSFIASAVGDLTGDGFADFLLGADAAGHNSLPYSGTIYGVYGKNISWNAAYDLNELAVDPPIVTGFEASRLLHTNMGGIGNTKIYPQSLAAGDINDDGFDDLIVGSGFAAHSFSQAGAVYVVFGTSGNLPSPMDLTTLNGTNGFRIDGFQANLNIGSAVGSGDVNGDGIDDLIMAGNPAGWNGLDGNVYVVFGKTTGWTASFDITTLNGTNGYRFTRQGGGSYRNSLIDVGNFNGDIYMDFSITCIGCSNNSTLVVFGRSSPQPVELTHTSFNGTNGVSFTNAHALVWASVSHARFGDINGDGFDDLVMGSASADHYAANNGSVYVVFGKASGWSGTFDLATLNGTNGFRLDGGIVPQGHENPYPGSSVAIGDVNKDNYDDILVGAPQASHGSLRSGSAYLVFGKAGAWPVSTLLSSVDGTFGARFDVPDIYGYAGMHSLLADVNDDGYSDLIVATGRGAGASEYEGAAKIVFGRAGTWLATQSIGVVSPGILDGFNGCEISGVAKDYTYMAAPMAKGDINGDGMTDLILSEEPRNDLGPGYQNTEVRIFVVYGRKGTCDSNYYNIDDID